MGSQYGPTKARSYCSSDCGSRDDQIKEYSVAPFLCVKGAADVAVLLLAHFRYVMNFLCACSLMLVLSAYPCVLYVIL